MKLNKTEQKIADYLEKEGPKTVTEIQAKFHDMNQRYIYLRLRDLIKMECVTQINERYAFGPESRYLNSTQTIYPSEQLTCPVLPTDANKYCFARKHDVSDIDYPQLYSEAQKYITAYLMILSSQDVLRHRRPEDLMQYDEIAAKTTLNEIKEPYRYAIS